VTPSLASERVQSEGVLPDNRDKLVSAPKKAPCESQKCTYNQHLVSVLTRRLTAEFGGVGSGLAGEFGGTISHLFFSIATQFANYQHRNYMGVPPGYARRRVDFAGSARMARRPGCFRSLLRPPASNVRCRVPKLPLTPTLAPRATRAGRGRDPWLIGDAAPDRRALACAERGGRVRGSRRRILVALPRKTTEPNSPADGGGNGNGRTYDGLIR
jgi:hypothetical protein